VALSVFPLRRCDYPGTSKEKRKGERRLVGWRFDARSRGLACRANGADSRQSLSQK